MARRHKLKNWSRKKSPAERMTFWDHTCFFLVVCIIMPALAIGFGYLMKYAFFIIMPLLMLWHWYDLKRWGKMY